MLALLAMAMLNAYDDTWYCFKKKSQNLTACNFITQQCHFNVCDPCLACGFESAAEEGQDNVVKAPLPVVWP